MSRKDIPTTATRSLHARRLRPQALLLLAIQVAPIPFLLPTIWRRSRTNRHIKVLPIRCSGYANSPGGRCMNCTRMNQECVFQPVSSTGTNAAFVHISALQGTVPVGTPVFGAYGQSPASLSAAASAAASATASATPFILLAQRSGL
ncbi:hypothetical protein CFO_g1986 [Ceratocystis platani]|uniref:Zn(2)-C6 fungal-type domain-containing protein n=1 Tax=Ceratocystis fimbriata f. sp. platani TaxID=88771 RepID=A0A0F8CYF5_CERFI|nr:hypothetical protein CFO_g1986 [Ceratocystis platani]